MRLYALLPCFIFAAACAETTHYEWAVPVKAEANLYRVDDKLYRSEQPVRDDAALIKKLGIKTVINLRYFDRRGDEKALAGSGIALFNQPLLTWRIRPKDIAATLYLIERQQQYGAVLVHCYHGADRTGLMVAMYRIVYQHWPVAEAKREMLQGPYGYHSIWVNLERLFSAEDIAQIRERLSQLRGDKNKLSPPYSRGREIF